MDFYYYDKIVCWNIYKVTCLPTGLVYVGITIGSLEDRLRQHIWAAKGKNKNHLHRAINEYGSLNFKIHLIEKRRHWYNNSYKAFERERFWMKELNSIAPNGYNSTKLSNIELKIK